MDEKQKLVDSIKEVLSYYFENDPWTGKPNTNYDESFSAQDAIDDIVNLLG